MFLQATHDPLALEPSIEEEIRTTVVEHFRPLYRERVNDHVATLLAVENYVCRFQYLHSVIGSSLFASSARILISGFSVGSEMIVARQFGFGKIYGVEVEQFCVNVCRSRLRNFSDMYLSLYDGDYLPYAAEQFGVIVSGHVIEHARNPNPYLQECMRVLVPSGYLFLEFPTRYHHKELHTGLPSFEWLPRAVRDIIVRVLSSRLSPLPADVQARYSSIITTCLQQISLSGIERLLKKANYTPIVLNSTKAAPGIIRCVIQKPVVVSL